MNEKTVFLILAAVAGLGTIYLALRPSQAPAAPPPEQPVFTPQAPEVSPEFMTVTYTTGYAPRCSRC